jgi:hypothetical protein
MAETAVWKTKRDLGPEQQRAAMRARRQQFLDLFDFSQGRGLEIGPLDAGIADGEAHDVGYVDVFDVDGIRDHYRDDPNVILELIPTIDYPLIVDGRARTLAEAAAPGAPFDWVIASHVIEHVPDVIGWLAQLAELTVEGGALLLAVPDRRYCFDRHRPPTTTGQALEAFEQRLDRPSTRAIYDHFSSVVKVDTRALWRGARPAGRPALIHDLGYTLHQLERGRAGEYVDCHVWTFTPQSLREQVGEWRALGVCDWYVERIVERPGTVEFHAVLRRLPAGEEVPASSESARPVDDLPDFLADEWARQERVEELTQEVVELRRRLRRLRRRTRALKERVAELDVPVTVRVRRGARRRARRWWFRATRRA